MQDKFTMSCGGFVVTGSRPPSASSVHRPCSAQLKHGYHILADRSTVDESLFGSAHKTKLDEAIIGFKAPWEYPKPPPPSHTFGVTKTKLPAKPKPKGKPLLWCPTPGGATHTWDKSKTKSSLDDSNCLWSTRYHFRHLKHTPSFVDESLFGSKLEEPTFEAPWNERKKGEKKKLKPYLWDPSGGSAITAHGGAEFDMNGNASAMQRPATALGITRKTRQSTGRADRPVWKP